MDPLLALVLPVVGGSLLAEWSPPMARDVGSVVGAKEDEKASSLDLADEVD